MILQLGSVQLRKINLGDIEVLRQWRNDEKIRKNMFFQETISPEMQLAWFNQLKATDFYFMIVHHSTHVGLINLCQDTENSKEGEVGLFIHNENYWGGPIPVYASMALLKFAFEDKNLKLVRAKVRKDNAIAQGYNRQLGFSKEENNYQVLFVEDYHKTLGRLIKRFE